MKNTLKGKQGITLIALVITIIILLLLAGVALWALNDGIIRNAEHSVNLFNKQANADQDFLDKAGRYMQGMVGLAPDVADITDEINLPEKKPLSEFPDYIPIYTIAQYAKIGSGEQGYVINDLNGTYVGTYNMNNNAKYVIMNDLDFSSQSLTEILPEFKGTLEGNGCTIKNIKIDATRSNVAYTRFIQYENAPTDRPGGMFVRVSGGTIKNLLVENANINSLESAGAIVAQGYNMTIDNCYVKNSNIKGGPNAGGIVGLDFNGSTIKNCKNINTKVDCSLADATNLLLNKKAGGIVGISFGSITLTNNQTISMAEPLDLRGGIISQVYYYYDEPINYNKEDITTLLGLTNNRSITITNCHVNKVKLTDGGGSAGIIGDIYSKSTKEISIDIKGCTSKNLTGDGAGIISMVHEENAINGNIVINECALQNANLFESEPRHKEMGVYYYLGQISGIIGSIVSKELTVSVTNCNVSGLNANSEENPGYNQCAGIISNIVNTKKAITISDCIVEKSNIFSGRGTNPYAAASGYTSCGGIVGNINSSNYDVERINFNNLVFANSEIYNEKGHTGGIIGYIGNIETPIDFENCKVLNVKMSGIVENMNNYRIEIGEKAGIVALIMSTKNDVIMNKCEVNNLEIIGEGIKHRGGLIAEIQDVSTLTINNCIVDEFNAVLKGGSWDDSIGYTASGGLVGRIGDSNSSNSLNLIKILNSSASNISFTNIEDSGHLGGIVGTGYSRIKLEIDKCKVKNILFNSYEEDKIIPDSNSSRIGMFGGILGHSTMDSVKITNCDVDDIEFNCIYGNAGGIAGALYTNSSIEKCNVNNAKITGLSTSGGIIGYAQSAGVKDCNANNIELGLKGNSTIYSRRNSRLY